MERTATNATRGLNQINERPSVSKALTVSLISAYLDLRGVSEHGLVVDCDVHGGVRHGQVVLHGQHEPAVVQHHLLLAPETPLKVLRPVTAVLRHGTLST